MDADDPLITSHGPWQQQHPLVWSVEDRLQPASGMEGNAVGEPQLQQSSLAREQQRQLALKVRVW